MTNQPDAPRTNRSRSRKPTWPLLIVILLIGLYFRTYSLFTWDEPSFRLHPDERFMTQVASNLRVPENLGQYFDSAVSTLNPRNVGHTLYVYGMLPQTLTRLTAVMLTPNERLPPTVPDPRFRGQDNAPRVPNPELSVPKLTFLMPLLNPERVNLTDYWEIFKVGRSWSTLFDLGSVFVTFLLARRLYGRRVALLAALFLAFAVLPIQLSHFFTVDTATAFFTLLSIYWAVRVAQGGSWLTFVALGLSIGGAMACRVTMAALGLVAIAAVVLRLCGVTLPRADHESEATTERKALPLRPSLALLSALIMAGLLALFTFRVLQPDAFVGSRPGSPMVEDSLLPRLDPIFVERGFFDLRIDKRFVDNIVEIGAYVSGEADSPPSFQWANRVRYLFAWQNIVLFGLGPLLGLAGWLAWGVATWQLVRRRTWIHLLPWLWIGFYFAWQGGIQGMTMRYYLNFYGLLAIFAAWGLLALWQGTPSTDRRQRLPNLFARGLTGLTVATTALWAIAFIQIYSQPHSRIAASAWIYNNIPTGSKLTWEVWDDPLPLGLQNRSPDLFGYTLLRTEPFTEDEQLKFESYTQADGTVKLGLLDTLDQTDYLIYSSNRAYDTISRMQQRFPATTRYYEAVFNGSLGFELIADIHSYPTLLGIPIPTPIYAEEAFSVYDHPRVLIFQKTPAYSRAKAERLITEPIAWSEVYKLQTALASRVPTALRLSETQWPAYREAGTWRELFGWNGLANAAPWLAWLLTLQLLGAACFLLLFRLLPALPDRGYALAKLLGVLLVAYLAWLGASLGNSDGRPWLPFSAPGLWGISGLLVLAGGFVGWKNREQLLIFARQRRMALLTAEGLFLLAFVGFVVIRALNPDLWHPARGGEKPMDLAYLTAVVKSPAFPPYDPWFAGGYINYYYFGFVLLGVLVKMTGIEPAVAYNLAVPTVFALTALGAWGVAYNLLAHRRSNQPRTERRALVGGLLAAGFVVLLGNLANAVYLLTGYATANVNRPEWAFWDATRLVGMALNDSTINEFPFFTFLYGDLHAHMIALPLLLGVLGLQVALLHHERHAALRRSHWFQRIGGVPLLLIALLAGALQATNTWDFPTALGLTGLTLLVLGWSRWQRGMSLSATVGWMLLGIGAVVLLSVLLFWPFRASFATEYASLQRWTGEWTPTSEYLQINGLWLFVLGATGLLLLRVRGNPTIWAMIVALVLIGLVAVGLVLGISAIWLIAVALIATLVLAIDLAFATVVQPRSRHGELRFIPPAGPFTMQVLIWVAAALGLTLLVELLVAKGDIGRMNTVFKFGMQSWVLFAITSAVALVRLWQWTNTRHTPQTWPAWLGWGVRGIAVLLAAAALIYPLSATPARLADRFDTNIGPTLNGEAYMAAGSWAESDQQFSFVEDQAAINWLRQNIDGTPILLEAQTEGYRWGGRVSINTGLPTLLGWPWHQTQQRSVARVTPVLEGRRQLIEQIYSSNNPIFTIQQLRQFGIEYVYHGQLERALYPSTGLTTFDLLAGQNLLELVYNVGETRIYRVTNLNPTPVVLHTNRVIVPPQGAPPSDFLLPVAVGALPEGNPLAWNRLAESQPIAVLLWLLVWYGLAVLGLPLAVLVFGRWADAGASWARLIGLLVLGYAVWLPVSARLWTNTSSGLGIGIGISILISLGALWLLGHRTRDSQHYPLRVGLRVLSERLQAGRKQIITAEILWLASFAIMVWIRALNPDLWQPIWGGEKPFEFGILNAVIRSPVLPVYSPFYSDGLLNYYYYGFFLLSLPIRITGIAPEIAFNLAIPTLFALLLVGAYTITVRLTGRSFYGMVGALFVGVVGNYASIIALPGSWSQPYRRIIEALTPGLAGFGERLGDWFVGPSRVIPNTINEFPFWAFLFADLHPHVIAMPITLLAIALALELFIGWRTVGAARETLLSSRFVALGLGALTLGALAITNSWDFPTYGLLFGGALLGLAWRRHPPDNALLAWNYRRKWLTVAIVLGVATGGLALLLYLPFLQTFEAQVRGVGLVTTKQTEIHYYLVIYGLFLAILVPSLFGAAWRLLGTQHRLLPALLIVPVLLIVVAISMPVLGLQLWLAVLILGGIRLLLVRRTTAETWFSVWMLVVALLVSLGIEFVYIRDHLTGGDWYRMNTVFKFGIQIWILFALAAAATLPRVLNRLKQISSTSAIAGTTGFIVLTLLALVFPIVGTPSRIAYNFPNAPAAAPTLDGLAFLANNSYEWEGNRIDLRHDAAAIRWLNTNISGTPVVLQSSYEFYRAYGVRIAANTGLPTVVSPLHESEQRDPSLVGNRDRDVATIYTTRDSTQLERLLARYRIEYIYAGPIERAAYGVNGTIWEQEGVLFNPVFRNEGVTIYQVRPEVLARSPLPPAITTIELPNLQPAPAPPLAPIDTPPTLDQAALERQIALDPTAAGPAFALAEIYRNQRNLEGALTVLRPAAAANPQDIALHHMLGDTLRDAGLASEAEAAYRQAITNDPSAGNYNKLGREMLLLGQVDVAEPALLRAIELDPQAAEPYFHLAEVLRKRNQLGPALERFQIYLERDPNGQFADQARQTISELTR
jgi:YYY domain-containing protein